MSDGYITMEMAQKVSGLHHNTLRRLLREGTVRGRKVVQNGQPRWMVMAASLREYVEGGQRFDSERRDRPPRLRGEADP